MGKIINYKDKLISSITDTILYDYRYEIFMEKDYIYPYVEAVYNFLERHHQIYRFREDLIDYFDQSLEFEGTEVKLNTDKLITSLVRTNPSKLGNEKCKIYTLKEGKRNGRGKSNH